MARSVLIVWGFLALLLGGCMGGPSGGSASLAPSAQEAARGPAAGPRTVAVPTRLSAGGRGSTSGSLLILGVN